MVFALDRPETDTGLCRLVVVPSPSWPEVFAPQHFTVPPVTTAQVCADPAEITVTFANPDTAAGLVLDVLVPVPSCPELFRPQHFTVPDGGSTAHECASPAITI